MPALMGWKDSVESLLLLSWLSLNYWYSITDIFSICLQASPAQTLFSVSFFVCFVLFFAFCRQQFLLWIVAHQCLANFLKSAGWPLSDDLKNFHGHISVYKHHLCYDTSPTQLTVYSITTFLQRLCVNKIKYIKVDCFQPTFYPKLWFSVEIM